MEPQSPIKARLSPFEALPTEIHGLIIQHLMELPGSDSRWRHCNRRRYGQGFKDMLHLMCTRRYFYDKFLDDLYKYEAELSVEEKKRYVKRGIAPNVGRDGVPLVLRIDVPLIRDGPVIFKWDTIDPITRDEVTTTALTWAIETGNKTAFTRVLDTNAQLCTLEHLCISIIAQRDEMTDILMAREDIKELLEDMNNTIRQETDRIRQHENEFTRQMENFSMERLHPVLAAGSVGRWDLVPTLLPGTTPYFRGKTRMTFGQSASLISLAFTRGDIDLFRMTANHGLSVGDGVGGQTTYENAVNCILGGRDDAITLNEMTVSTVPEDVHLEMLQELLDSFGDRIPLSHWILSAIRCGRERILQLVMAHLGPQIDQNFRHRVILGSIQVGKFSTETFTHLLQRLTDLKIIHSGCDEEELVILLSIALRGLREWLLDEEVFNYATLAPTLDALLDHFLRLGTYVLPDTLHFVVQEASEKLEDAAEEVRKCAQDYQQKYLVSLAT